MIFIFQRTFEIVSSNSLAIAERSLQLRKIQVLRKGHRSKGNRILNNLNYRNKCHENLIRENKKLREALAESRKNSP